MPIGLAMSAETTVARAIAEFLRDRGSDTAFVVAGGASLHLIHAFADTPGCSFVPMHHEQSAAMAADGFSRSSGRVGVAIATSGPGATNLITGIAGCYYDSIPAVFVTGQVSTTRMVGSTGVRQIGFQETPIVEMVRGITKVSLEVRASTDIRRMLEEAFWTATHDRQGPVLLDVPDDIQRARVVWEELAAFAPPLRDSAELSDDIEFVREAMSTARRPVLIGGAGVVLSGAESAFREFAESWGAPVALTWGAPHLLPAGHELRLGLFGTHGSRHANFAVQNADLVVSIGSRLDTKATGSPVTTFARGATKVMIDIDAAELKKFEHFGLRIDRPVQSDASAFISSMETSDLPRVPATWIEYCDRARTVCDGFDRDRRTGPGINPYGFMKQLGASAPDDADVFVDTGCALPWLMTGFPLRRSQRLLHDLNNTAMGWSLPAAIGGGVASPQRPNVCVIGDGSLMMTMHDLVTLASLNTRARVVVIDNSGYSMIRQTQDQWLASEYHSSSIGGGLHFPDYEALATATRFAYLDVVEPADVVPALAAMWQASSPILLRVSIDPSWRVIPQVKFGRPNEDMEPLMPRSEFDSLMIIAPMSASRVADG